MEKVYIVISTNYEDSSVDSMEVFSQKDKAQEAVDKKTLEIYKRLKDCWKSEEWEFLIKSCDFVFMQNKDHEWYEIKLIEKDVL